VFDADELDPPPDTGMHLFRSAKSVVAFRFFADFVPAALAAMFALSVHFVYLIWPNSCRGHWLRGRKHMT
jgi:hypothetical protein